MFNRPLSQLHSIRGKRCDSLCSEKSTSSHCVATTRTKQFHVLLKAMHAFEISIHIKSRQVMFQEKFKRTDCSHCERVVFFLQQFKHDFCLVGGKELFFHALRASILITSHRVFDLVLLCCPLECLLTICLVLYY